MVSSFALGFIVTKSLLLLVAGNEHPPPAAASSHAQHQQPPPPGGCPHSSRSTQHSQHQQHQHSHHAAASPHDQQPHHKHSRFATIAEEVFAEWVKEGERMSTKNFEAAFLEAAKRMGKGEHVHYPKLPIGLESLSKQEFVATLHGLCMHAQAQHNKQLHKQKRAGPAATRGGE